MELIEYIVTGMAPEGKREAEKGSPALTPPSLVEETTEIHPLHESIFARDRRRLESGIEIGRRLVDVKTRLENRQYLSWARDNLEFSLQTALNYRRLFK